MKRAISDSSLIDVANHFEKVEAKIFMLSAAVGNCRRTCDHTTAVNTQSDTHVYVGPSRPYSQCNERLFRKCEIKLPVRAIKENVLKLPSGQVGIVFISGSE